MKKYRPGTIVIMSKHLNLVQNVIVQEARIRANKWGAARGQYDIVRVDSYAREEKGEHATACLALLSMPDRMSVYFIIGPGVVKFHANGKEAKMVIAEWADPAFDPEMLITHIVETAKKAAEMPIVINRCLNESMGVWMEGK